MPKDFSGQNLRGRSFKGQDLTGANFSKADIRGANFTNAILKSANFSHAKAGLQKPWAIFLVIVSLVLSTLSGLISASFTVFVVYLFLPATIKKSSRRSDAKGSENGDEDFERDSCWIAYCCNIV